MRRSWLSCAVLAYSGNSPGVANVNGKPIDKNCWLRANSLLASETCQAIQAVPRRRILAIPCWRKLGERVPGHLHLRRLIPTLCNYAGSLRGAASNENLIDASTKAT